ncbi:MAG: hypothetical protein AAF206_15875, partial [Bacteroidota bacterium]
MTFHHCDTQDRLAQDANFICTNPNCQHNTKAIAPYDLDMLVYYGHSVMIYSFLPGHFRYDPQKSSDFIGSIQNGLFLCNQCAYDVESDEIGMFS